MRGILATSHVRVKNSGRTIVRKLSYPDRRALGTSLLAQLDLVEAVVVLDLGDAVLRVGVGPHKVPRAAVE